LRFKILQTKQKKRKDNSFLKTKGLLG